MQVVHTNIIVRCQIIWVVMEVLCCCCSFFFVTGRHEFSGILGSIQPQQVKTKHNCLESDESAGTGNFSHMFLICVICCSQSPHAWWWTTKCAFYSDLGKLGQAAPVTKLSLKIGPDSSGVKNLPANAGDVGSIPGSRKSPGEGNGNPLQYSCLGNLTDRRTWRAIVHGVTEESDTT